MEKQLDRLKHQASAGGAGGEVGNTGDRLKKLQQDAGVLANTTENMLKGLEGNTAKPHHHKSVFQKKNSLKKEEKKVIHSQMREKKKSSEEGGFSVFQGYGCI